MAEMSADEKRVRRILQLPSQMDFRKLSVELTDERFVRVNPIVRDRPLISVFYDDVTTLYEAFKRGLNVSNNGPCLGWRPGPDKPYHWVTYDHVYRRASNFGAGLIEHGCPAGQESFIGIYSQNRVGWTIAEQACNMYSMIVVPLYDTLGPDACTHIINQCEITTVVCDGPKKLPLLLKRAHETPSLKRIILMDKFTEDDVNEAAEKHITLISFRDIERVGVANSSGIKPPNGEDIATICYTSGTTGLPKGVILTHSNLIATAAGFLAMKGDKFTYSKEDVYISYLPLAHVYEKFVQLVLFMHGCRIGYFRGDVLGLMDDVGELQPTFFPLVPRLMNRMYDKINSGVAAKPVVIRKFFAKALKKKELELRKGIIRGDGFWDKAFKKPRQSVGGRVKLLSIGAAPVSPKIITFGRSVFGCNFVEGYGQTECSAICTVTPLNDTSTGHVGAPVPCFAIKLESVPEMEYYAEKDQGEVCLKGPGVFKGYYKDPVKTAEALDKDGWLHTGDIGQWLSNGALKIIDRKKHIFKLAQGEYIAPEKIENTYIRSPFVAQIFIYGESLKSTLIAIVVPDPETVPKWAAAKGIRGDLEYLCRNKVVKAATLKSLQDIGREGGLHSFEQVKDVYLSSEMFSIENELLTPTMKNKRPSLKKYFAKQIEEMYSHHG
ncbi:long-chain-fatty-acid--CoA ligase 1-like [Glandiceps talaboti]